MLESFRAKVTAIEESKDLDDIKVQELIGSLHTYELSLPNHRKSKSLALKTVNERVVVHDSSDDDAVEKDIAYLAKNFRKFFTRYATSLSTTSSSDESWTSNLSLMVLRARDLLFC